MNDWMRPTLGGLGFTHVARCVECDGQIFKHPTWSHFGRSGERLGSDHKAEARLGTIEDWGESPEAVVLALHVVGEGTECEECGRRWPCPTVQAFRVPPIDAPGDPQ